MNSCFNTIAPIGYDLPVYGGAPIGIVTLTHARQLPIFEKEAITNG
jgi:hypothetical protein